MNNLPRKLIHITKDEMSRLRCDTQGCGYVMPPHNIPFGSHLIGIPCPRCGASLLTWSDYIAAKRFLRVVAWLNKWFGWLGTKEPKRA